MTDFSIRAVNLVQQDEEDFKAESEGALRDALTGASQVKLHAECARDLSMLSFMQQVHAISSVHVSLQSVLTDIDGPDAGTTSA